MESTKTGRPVIAIEGGPVVLEPPSMNKAICEFYTWFRATVLVEPGTPVVAKVYR
jgi:hypothetical protein